MPLFFLFVAVPILEIWLFMVVGARIGTYSTLAVVVLTAVVGTALVRRQGLAVLARVQSAVRQGRLPAVELLDGVLILAAGLLLLTPGFFTDAVGFFLVVPPTRAIARGMIVDRLRDRIVVHPMGRQTPASRIEVVDDSDSEDPRP